MVRLVGLLSLLSFAFTLYVLLDIVLTDGALVRNMPKLVWVLVVLFVPLVGAIAWFVAGRPQHATVAPGGTRSRPGRRDHPAGSNQTQPPRGPDDDPDFLRSLDERLRDEDVDPDDEPRS